MKNKKKILLTGSAGFIGFHVTKKLLTQGYIVQGIDNMNDYYDVSLKESRLREIVKDFDYNNAILSIEDRHSIKKIFSSFKPDIVINLAAQAGVRYSLKNPYAYIDSNIIGFMNILECCRHHKVKHLIYASSSSVYGMNTKMPFSVHDNVDHPVSLYAATKKANELMAHTYSHLYGLPTTGLRFFTVYGPWGRPDMALFLFTKAIMEKKPIQVFNHGNMRRDFTYIDDIVEGIVRLVEIEPKPNINWSGLLPDPGTSIAPYKIYNIGNNNPVKLMDMISILEKELDTEAIKEFMPIQPGDVPHTFADIEDLERDVGYKPSTSIEEGIKRFVNWYKDYYKI